MAKIAAFFAFLASIAGMLFFRSESKRKGEELKGQVEARKTEHAATEALVDGLQKEGEVTHEIPNDPDYDISSGKRL